MNFRTQFALRRSPLSPRRVNAALAACAAAAGLVAFRQNLVWAQERARAVNQNNPQPRGLGGDALNTGRALDDKYWGVTNADRAANAPAFARAGASTMDLDGWSFQSRHAARRQIITLENDPTAQPGGTATPNPPGPAPDPGSPWTLQNGGPAQNISGPDYRRSPAKPRIANNDDQPEFQSDQFTWTPTVPGAAGEFRRYVISVYIPGPALDTATPPESRISDARYKVIFALPNRTGTGYTVQTRVVFVPQGAEGSQRLRNGDGSDAYFPFYSDATYGAPGFGNLLPDLGNAKARVVLDNSTEDQGSDQFVVADAIRFVEQQDAILAAPAATPRHGGRKTDTAAPGVSVPNQPVAGPDRDQYAFVNNNISVTRRDPQTDPANGAFVPTKPYDPANQSVVFEGPTAFIRPTFNEGGVVVDATGGIRPNNFETYRRANTQPAPLFSHMQVLVGRTEYVLDPEIGVPEGDRIGTRSMEIGCVYAFDWKAGSLGPNNTSNVAGAGVPLWRFPDRTYLPAGTLNPQDNSPVTGAGLRNPNVGTRPLIPGIAAIDRDADGFIQDDEVYIVGTGAGPISGLRNSSNRDGGVNAAITIVPNISVQAQVTVPNPDPNGTNPNATTYVAGQETESATPGRYFVAPNDPAVGTTPPTKTAYAPVRKPVAFVASNNGVVYAIDPYGNNDSRYFENPTAPPAGQPNRTEIGSFRAGSTNLLWTFSPTSRPRRTVAAGGQVVETELAYNRRLKREIPATGPFGSSAPVVAYVSSAEAEADRNVTNGPITADQEQRLFIGNNNGVLYALAADAEAGYNDSVNPLLGVQTAPFRKGEQPDDSINPDPVAPINPEHRTDLRWWFETQGAIAASPAVSRDRLPDTGPDANRRRGVYVSTLEGRVYCIDWEGPVTRYGNHLVNLNWNGAAGDAAAVPAEAALVNAVALNDNYRFHNDTSAQTLLGVTGQAGTTPFSDGTEGMIRPRWTFPNRYRDTNDGAAPLPDSSNDAATLNDRNSVLPPRRPADNSGAQPGVLLAEPDALAPIRSAPVLMDFQWQDPDPDPVTGVLPPPVLRHYVVVTANDLPVAGAPTEGRVYLLDQAGNRVDFLTNPQVRNAVPDVVANRRVIAAPNDYFQPRAAVGNAAPAWTYRFTYDDFSSGAPNLANRNSRGPAITGTLSPTRRSLPTVFAGGVGALYAVDIDPRTSLFVRWRRDAAEQQALGPIPAPEASFPIPQDEGASDRINPMPQILTDRNLDERPVLARTMPLNQDTSSVDGALTITGGPLQNRNTNYPAGAFPTPASPPTTPIKPLDDLGANPVRNAAGNLEYNPQNPFVAAVNQEIFDPLADSRGTDPIGSTTVNTAQQYPMLVVTTTNGTMHFVSTNTEGEDKTTATLDEGRSLPLGWAFATGVSPVGTPPEFEFLLSRFRYNPNQILLNTRRESAGAPGGALVVTNAYFEATDPNLALYPGQTVPPPPAPQIATPRPGEGTPPLVGFPFRPRQLSPGVVDDPGTPLVDETVQPDPDTGKSGFPLDGDGLFYDVYAPATRPNDRQDLVNLRLPDYGDNLIPELPGSTTDVTLRDNNPAGTNALWIFVGGQDGIMNAFTPTLAGQSGGGGGGYGTTRVGPEALGLTGNPRVEIFDENDFTTLQGSAQSGAATRPDPYGRLGGTRSRAGKGKKNFFEWGETVYIIAYDLLANEPATPVVAGRYYVDETQGPSTTLTITNLDTGARIATQPVRLERIGGAPNGTPASYAYDPNFAVPTGPAPADPSVAARLGLAFYRFTLGQSSEGRAQTPGARIQVSVRQRIFRTDARGNQRLVRSFDSPGNDTPGGPTEAAAVDRVAPVFAIANPLGIQAFLAATTTLGTGAPVPALLTRGPNDTRNAIGPFANDDAGAKDRVLATGGTPTAGTDDPDNQRNSYYQALANGNTVVRREMEPYIITGGTVRLNNKFGQQLRDSANNVDPKFYFPVAAGMHYASHDSTGSTTLGPARQNLRLLNRSRLGALGRVGVKTSDVLWHYWPGALPNTEGTDGLATDNPRQTPVGMSSTGVINALPWENAPIEVLPWRSSATLLNPSGTVRLGANASKDYPNIRRSATGDNIRALGPSGELTRGRGSLPGKTTETTDFSAAAGFQNLTDANSAPGPNIASSVTIAIPRFQPANLAAIGNLTSTYVAPNSADRAPLSGNGPLINITEGPLQLPRGVAARTLRETDVAGGVPVIAPFGYTAKLIVYIDSNGNGQWDQGANTGPQTTGVDYGAEDLSARTGDAEAFREVEVWVGVPVDVNLAPGQPVVELTSRDGGLGHGLGIQNGLLGYNAGTGPLDAGFVPPPFAATPQAGPVATPANAANRKPYDRFFKPFNVQNRGNINLWNLRASQRIEVPNGSFGDGNPFTYLGMRSASVDGRFGIAAEGADPIGAMPQIVTSLDRRFDAAWDDYAELDTAANAFFNPGSSPQSAYNLYYSKFGGRHTLHKALVGDPSQGSLLSMPDLPDTVSSLAAGATSAQVGVAVPLGTPSGEYVTSQSSNPAASPFAVFEDHDTDQAYNPYPRLNGTVVTPAGPLYGRRNDDHPGTTRAILPIETVFRPRGFTINPSNPTGPPVLDYQPNTTFQLKAKVIETGLTGQLPDLADPNMAAPNIITGLLPGIDPFSLIDNRVAGATRPAAALTPASYRSRTTGEVHVYFSRNATTDGAAAAGPSDPFRLFHSHLGWNVAGGFFQATAPGAPVAQTNVGAGQWFSAPGVVTVPPLIPGTPDGSNTSPFVLHDTVDSAGNYNASDGATLFWLNTQATPGGAPVSQIYYAPINAADGVPGTPVAYLRTLDPALRRFGPKAVIVDPGNGTKTAFVFYYGGQNGRWNLYYGATGADDSGRPTAPATRENLLVTPTAITSASEPTPIVRMIQPAGGGTPVPVVDLYYTGVSRSNQNPDIYLTRYRINNSGGGATLVPIPLDRVSREKLDGPGRDLLYRGQHISWGRSLSGAARPLLPEIFVGRDLANAAPVTVQNRWQYDEATGLLYQSFSRTVNGTATTTIVYVDSSAGTVRFRGRGAPRSTEYVFASYTPATYRVSPDDVADTAAYTFMDRFVLPGTDDTNTQGGILRRPAGNVRTDRQWVIWQKGARAGRAATLFYTTRRVGVDLKTLVDPQTSQPYMAPNESFRLSQRDATTGNSSLEDIGFTVNGATVPFDVDFANGRVYVSSEYEGQGFALTGSVVTIVNGQQTNVRTLTVPLDTATPRTRVLGFVSESVDASSGKLVPFAEVPTQQTVNEGQAAAFLDLFDGRGINRPAGLPFTGIEAADPTLQPGRVWLFWSSPRSRSGAGAGLLPSGYDLFWQTLAPRFEAPAF